MGGVEARKLKRLKERRHYSKTTQVEGDVRKKIIKCEFQTSYILAVEVEVHCLGYFSVTNYPKLRIAITIH